MYEGSLLGCHLGDLKQHHETILNNSTIIKFNFFYPKTFWKVCIIVFNKHAEYYLFIKISPFHFILLPIICGIFGKHYKNEELHT